MHFDARFNMKDKIFLTPLFDFGKWHIREREEAGGGGNQGSRNMASRSGFCLHLAM